MRSARRENSIQLVVHGAKILLLSSQLRQQPLQDSTCFFYASRTSVDRIAFDQRHGQSDKVSWSRVTPKSSISQNLAMTTSLPAVAAYLQIVEPARSVATKAMIAHITRNTSAPRTGAQGHKAGRPTCDREDTRNIPKP